MTNSYKPKQDWTKEALQEYVDRIGPWHYCHQLPYGIVTGTSKPDQCPDKMDRLIAHGAFDRPVYNRVLDLGANSGIVSMWFADNKKSNVDAIEAGIKYYPQLELAVDLKDYSDTITVYESDIRFWKYPKNEYDLILFLGTMHHIPEEDWVSLFINLLKANIPGGQIVVQTKTNIPVLEILKSVGYLMPVKLYDSEFYERSAWKAFKDPMKI